MNPMKNIFATTVCLFFVSVFAAPALAQVEASEAATLSYQGGNLKAVLTWLPQYPAVVGPESKLQVQWLNGAEQATDIQGDFRVVLFMPTMGHGSSPTKIAKLTEPGLFQVSKIYFTMPGIWEIRVTFRPADGSTPETQTLTLTPAH
jgi:hypothetical protein